jgi:hypothetical protein
VFDVDIITQNLSIKDTGTEKILEDPGYNSILLPHNLEKLGIRVFTKGNVASAYDNENRLYKLGRCDKFTEYYPHVAFEETQFDPETDAELVFDELDNLDNISDNSMESLGTGGKLTRIKDEVFRISFLTTFSTNDNKEMKSRGIVYFFTFNNRHYRATIHIPFVKDDGIEHWLHDNEFTEKSAPLFEERLIEILNTIEKL